jgi:8-oxo-dGTP pyrophosphatase MutT (NUDIX family)
MESLRESLRRRLAARELRRDAPEGTPRAAVAVIVAPGERGPELLFIERAEREGDPWSGHMALPGGRVEPRDPDWLFTAVRETREEVGAPLSEGDLAGELDDLRPVSAPARIVVRPFVFVVPERPALTLNHEVARVEWAPLDELVHSRGTVEVFHLGAPRIMPCYLVAGRAVWGMTQRILEPFLPLALER